MPQNAGYMHAAYVAAGLIYGLYALSLVLRRRTTRGRLDRATERG